MTAPAMATRVCPAASPARRRSPCRGPRPPLPEPVRIDTAVMQTRAYASPLARPSRRSFVSSLASGPWRIAARRAARRVPGHADRHDDQERLAERLLRDRLQGALLVRRLPAVPDGQLDRENTDDRVDRPAGDEAGSGEPLELPRCVDVLALRLGLTDRHCPALRFRVI